MSRANLYTQICRSAQISEGADKGLLNFHIQVKGTKFGSKLYLILSGESCVPSETPWTKDRTERSIIWNIVGRQSFRLKYRAILSGINDHIEYSLSSLDPADIAPRTAYILNIRVITSAKDRDKNNDRNINAGNNADKTKCISNKHIFFFWEGEIFIT